MAGADFVKVGDNGVGRLMAISSVVWDLLCEGVLVDEVDSDARFLLVLSFLSLSPLALWLSWAPPSDDRLFLFFPILVHF